MARIINIDPIDLQPDVAVGISLPIASKYGKIFVQTYTTLEQAKTNFINLVLTNEGERIMQPDFGCSIKRKLFEPITESFGSDIEKIIRTKAAYWLPYITIVSLDVNVLTDDHLISINITIALNGNLFKTETVTFNLPLPT